MKIIDGRTLSESEIIRETVEVLAAGGLVVFPTETTYGAGVDATNPEAVAKVLRYKARREGKPLSIAVADIEMAEKYIEVNDSARRLYQRFLPGPVTVISKSKNTVAPGVTSEFGTLGIRIPAYPLIVNIVKQFGKPMTATSANASDGARPYRIDQLLKQLSQNQQDSIDLIIDMGELPPNPPSTVIDTTLSTPVTFRQGDISLDSNSTNNQTYTLTTNSTEETMDLAGRLLLKYWNQIKTTGLVIALHGSLGAGKTVFTKGAAKFLQIMEPITSPTYTYIEEYDFTRHNVTGKLFHLDLWKISDAAEVERLEINQMLKPNHVTVIEWADLGWPTIQQQLDATKVPALSITITNGANPNQRSLEIQEPK